MAVTEYTWNPLTDSVIEETDGAGNVLVEYTNEPAPYGPLISERRGSESRQYHFDALGSTRALTDDGEGVADTFAYDAWGSLQGSSTAPSTRFLWLGLVGYMFNIGLDDSYVRNRLFSSRVSRWRSPEPNGLAEGLNRFQYCDSSPLTYYDPLGLAQVPPPPNLRCCEEEPLAAAWGPGGLIWYICMYAPPPFDCSNRPKPCVPPCECCPWDPRKDGCPEIDMYKEDVGTDCGPGYIELKYFLGRIRVKKKWCAKPCKEGRCVGDCPQEFLQDPENGAPPPLNIPVCDIVFNNEDFFDKPKCGCVVKGIVA